MKTGKWWVFTVAAFWGLAQLSAWAGDLTPPGAPGSTMHTLEEVYQKQLTATQQVVTLQQQVMVLQQQVLLTQASLADIQARLLSAGMQQISGDMVLIPAGSFVMGATTNVGHESYSGELPQHTVYVSAFYMDKYEVPISLWNEIYTWATNKGYAFGKGLSEKGPTYPVQNTDWYDAIAWCNARSQRDGFIPCYTNANGTVYTNAAGNSFEGDCNWSASGYRLPTEAEWEKAARGGGANRRFPWGDVNTIQHARANYYADPESYSYDTSPTMYNHPTYATIFGIEDTSPVGSFVVNGYGLYDMAGNLLEWSGIFTRVIITPVRPRMIREDLLVDRIG